VNKAFSERTGKSVKETVGKSTHDMFSTENADSFSDHDRNVLESGRIMEREVEVLDPDGRVRIISATKFPIPGPGGTPELVGTIMADVTERNRAADALRESEERFRSIVENSPGAIFLKDLDGKFRIVNKRFEEWYGVSAAEVEGKTSHEVFQNEFADQYIAHDREALQSRKSNVAEYEAPFADGEVHRIVASKFPVFGSAGEPIGVGTISYDVSEQRNAEESLRQAQKMEAVGQLTGGMAHDFNNLLTVIHANAELLSERLSDPALHVFTDGMKTAAQRGGDLIQRLLAFSRQQPLEPRSIDLNVLIDGLSDLLRQAIGGGIKLSVQPVEDLRTCSVDPGQLESAILNLAINARDAMPGGGDLTIETSNVYLAADDIATHEGVAAGQFVMLAITDNGSGMTPKTVDQAFEPFFTTKEPGKGTGLGLSIVYGFVNQSGGHVEIDSTVGRGTTVRIYLPVAGVDEAASEAFDAAGGNDGAKGTEKILVVDDNDMVRVAVTALMEHLGYQVLEAGNGPDALARLNDHPDIDLLFTDIVMSGGMNGVELAHRAKERYADLRVLLTSGHADEEIIAGKGASEIGPILAKPYLKDALASALRDALED